MDTLVFYKFDLKRKKILVDLERSIAGVKAEYQKNGVLNSGMYWEKAYEVLYHSGELTIKALLDSYKEVHEETGDDLLVKKEQDVRNEINALYPSEYSRIRNTVRIDIGEDCQPRRLNNLYMDLQEYANQSTNVLIETEKRKQRAHDVQKDGCGPLAKELCDRLDEIAKQRSSKRVFLDIPYSQYGDCEGALVSLLKELELEPVIAKDKVTSSAVLCKICANIRTCKYGISDISSASNSVSYEYGLMHSLGMKVCLLLRDDEVKFSDIHGLEHHSYKGLQSFKVALLKGAMLFLVETPQGSPAVFS